MVELEREMRGGGQNTKIWPKEGMGLRVESGSGKISLNARVGWASPRLLFPQDFT